jgi:hypothetical protein
VSGFRLGVTHLAGSTAAFATASTNNSRRATTRGEEGRNAPGADIVGREKSYKAIVLCVTGTIVPTAAHASNGCLPCWPAGL